MLFNDEPILDWKEKGVHIHNKGHEYDQNIFIYYNSIACVSYKEFKVLDDEEYSTHSTTTVYLSNSMIVEITFAEPSHHIFRYFQNHRMGDT
jgi:hypothetical protein